MVHHPPATKRKRRNLLLFLGWFLAVTPGLSAGPATAPASWSREDAAHLLRRAAFGGTPRQIDRLHAMGRDAAVEYLLTGQRPGETEPVFAAVTLEDFEPSDDPLADRKAAAKKANLTPADRETLMKARRQAE